VSGSCEHGNVISGVIKGDSLTNRVTV